MCLKCKLWSAVLHSAGQIDLVCDNTAFCSIIKKGSAYSFPLSLAQPS